MVNQEMMDNLITELRRGTLVLAVLSQLRKPQYGYSLLQRLEERNVRIEANTLYPLLRRLESQKLLDSLWDTTENRPRKYYVLSQEGKEVLQALSTEWKNTSFDIARLLEEE